MAFGLCNAPGTFQRLMERLFGDQQCQSLLLYLNDVVVFSSSVAQHLEHLEVVLSRLEHEVLKVKLSKCAFFQREVKYLGHVISTEGVSSSRWMLAIAGLVQSSRRSKEARYALSRMPTVVLGPQSAT